MFYACFLDITQQTHSEKKCFLKNIFEWGKIDKQGNTEGI